MSKNTFFASLGMIGFYILNAQQSEKLIEYGFENIVEHTNSDSYTLFYEDNLYRFPADGIQKVLELLKMEELKTTNTLVLLNKGIPIVELVVLKKDLEDFRNSLIGDKEFASKLIIRFTDKTYNIELAKNSSYFKTDLDLRFVLDYTLGNFDNPIRQRVNFQPFLTTDLSRGVNLQGYYNYPEFDELGNIEPQVGLLKVSNDFKLSKRSFLNTNFGFFNFNRLGFTMNYLKFLYSDKLRLNFHTGITRFGRLNKNLILYYDLNTDLRVDFHTDITYRINKYDMDLTFRYGSFILGDIGYTAQVRRFSGQRFIGLFYRKTNYGTMVGFDFSLPIPIRKYNRKLPLRTRLFERFYLPYNYRSDSDVGLLYYQGENIVNTITDYFPEIIRKGIIRAKKRDH